MNFSRLCFHKTYSKKYIFLNCYSFILQVLKRRGIDKKRIIKKIIQKQGRIWQWIWKLSSWKEKNVLISYIESKNEIKDNEKNIIKAESFPSYVL